MTAPADNLVSNWAYMVASLAWSLKGWAAMHLPENGRWQENGGKRSGCCEWTSSPSAAASCKFPPRSRGASDKSSAICSWNERSPCSFDSSSSCDCRCAAADHQRSRSSDASVRGNALPKKEPAMPTKTTHQPTLCARGPRGQNRQEPTRPTLA